MLYLAYDGSLNGDWISRYAIRFASHIADRALTLIHVQDGTIPAELLERKIEHLERECREEGVELVPQILPPGRNVLSTMLDVIPAGTQSYVVCGTRARPGRKPFLAGTLSEKLLRLAHFHTLAIRVVHPGLLGAPRDLLLPLAGHPRGFVSAWAFFRLFLPEVESVHLLRGMVVSPLRLRHLSSAQMRALREHGARYLATVTDEISRGRGAADFHLDTRIVLCEDWVGEILVQVSRLKANLILIGASEQALLHRVLHRNPLERLLRGTPCDVGIYRGL